MSETWWRTKRLEIETSLEWEPTCMQNEQPYTPLFPFRPEHKGYIAATEEEIAKRRETISRDRIDRDWKLLNLIKKKREYSAAYKAYVEAMEAVAELLRGNQETWVVREGGEDFIVSATRRIHILNTGPDGVDVEVKRTTVV